MAPDKPTTTVAHTATTTGFWFLVVGAAAALTHLLVFHLAEPYLWAEVANAAGFGVAFAVSFVGHRFLSFRDTRASLGHSLRRFAVTAVAGFAVNELVFSLLLRVWEWPSLLALLVALCIAAGQTFVLGRFWAFHR